jgi:hypothetical protein
MSDGNWVIFAIVGIAFVGGLVFGEPLYMLTSHGKRLRASREGYAAGYHFGEWDATRGSVFEAIMAQSTYKKSVYATQEEQQAFHKGYEKGWKVAQDELLLSKPLVSWAN